MFIGWCFNHYPGDYNGVALPKKGFYFCFGSKVSVALLDLLLVVWVFLVDEYSADCVKCRNFAELQHLMLPRSGRK